MRHRQALADFNTSELHDRAQEALNHIEGCGRCRGRVEPDGLDLEAIWGEILSELREVVPMAPPAARLRGPAVALASLLGVMLLGMAGLLWGGALAPDPGGRGEPMDAPAEDPFLDPFGRQGWLDGDEPGLASLYDGGPHVLHLWGDHWSILAGYYEGSLCFEGRSSHGGVAGCETEISLPWAVPDVFSAIAGMSIRREGDLWAPYGTGTVIGLTSINVARVELTFEGGATVAIPTLGRSDEIAFGAYGHSYSIDAEGRVTTVSGYDDRDRLLGVFDFSSEECLGFDALRGRDIQAMTEDGDDVSPRQHDLLLLGSPRGCGVGVGIDFERPEP